MPRRNLQFYSELVIVTVLSLVAANSWIRWITQTLNHFYPGSLRVDFFVALLTTILAVVILNSIFADADDADDKKKFKSPFQSKTDHPEVRSGLYPDAHK